MPALTDLAHPDETPRVTSLMIALHLANGDLPNVQFELTELIAWLAFDKPKQAEAGANHVRVLVVDDSEDKAHVGSVLFSHLGHTAVPAHNSQEAVALTATFDPDVILLDMDAREIDAREVVRQVRQHSKHAFIVGVSNYIARDAGCDQYLTRPIDLAKIRKLIATLSPISR
jgi:CheY-like chemotaxis protein